MKKQNCCKIDEEMSKKDIQVSFIFYVLQKIRYFGSDVYWWILIKIKL